MLKGKKFDAFALETYCFLYILTYVLLNIA